jgi:hypothetical protein
MADIDVVPKRRSLTWLWILAAIVIVALILWALTANNDPAPVGLVTPAIPSPNAVTASPLDLLLG